MQKITDIWQKVLKSGIAFILILNYGVIGYIEAFTSVKFPKNFIDDFAFAAAVGLVTFFVREINFLIEKYKVVRKDEAAPDDDFFVKMVEKALEKNKNKESA